MRNSGIGVDAEMQVCKALVQGQRKGVINQVEDVLGTPEASITVSVNWKGSTADSTCNDFDLQPISALNFSVFSYR